MRGCGAGCLGRIAALVVLAVIVVAAWRFGPDLVDRYGHYLESGSEPDVAASIELADAALTRFDRVVAGELETASFTEAELESVLRYRWAEHLPPGVDDPTVRLRGGELRVGVRVATEVLPRFPEMERIQGMLPDTVPVEFRGTLLTLEGRDAAFLVRRIDAAGIPVPRRVHASLLEALQSPRRDGVPEEAFVFSLPPGIGSVHMADETLMVRGTR